MAKWKRRLIFRVSVLVPLLAIGGWVFHHWLGFMLRSPMPVSERYDWPMTVVVGDGTPGFVDGVTQIQ